MLNVDECKVLFLVFSFGTGVMQQTFKQIINKNKIIKIIHV